ncbi:MAG TPA: AAA family ATPase [Steroidobacteraceae bacterium]|nr:AAA family ATPase [Steroidobacteraceae bacterium]
MARRLRRGESMVVYGPKGIGKTRLLLDLEARLHAAGISCARSPQTQCLDDVTRALEAAFPAIDTQDVARRTARERLWNAADLQGGVLLLDHLTAVTNAMVGFLRRLRGGVMGVISAVDVEVERERRRLRPWRLGALSVRMPPAPPELIRALLQERMAALKLPCVDRDAERRLILAARGRPGWILQCADLLADGRYWHGAQLFVSVVSTDTEIALRRGLPAHGF